MAVTNTTIADLVPSEKALGGLVNVLLNDANELVTSGLAARGPEVDAVAGGGPRKASIPFLNPLSTAEYNISSDAIGTAGAVGKLTADEFSAIRHDVNYGWGTADLARMVTQYAAEGGIAAGIAQYWNGIYQQIAAKAIVGALACDASLTIGDGTAALSLDLMTDAMVDAGLFMDQFDILMVSPVTKGKLMKLNGGQTFQHKSDTKLKFDTFAGFKVITTNAFGNTASVIARSGALAFGEGTPAGMVPIELERVANGGTGGGANILHSRRSVVIHPQGFGVDTDMPIAPTLTNLADGTKWVMKVPQDQVGFRKISHT